MRTAEIVSVFHKTEDDINNFVCESVEGRVCVISESATQFASRDWIARRASFLFIVYVTIAFSLFMNFSGTSRVWRRHPLTHTHKIEPNVERREQTNILWELLAMLASSQSISLGSPIRWKMIDAHFTLLRWVLGIFHKSTRWRLWPAKIHSVLFDSMPMEAKNLLGTRRILPCISFHKTQLVNAFIRNAHELLLGAPWSESFFLHISNSCVGGRTQKRSTVPL